MSLHVVALLCPIHCSYGKKWKTRQKNVDSKLNLAISERHLAVIRENIKAKCRS